MFRKLLEAEAGHRDRAAGLEAARERFYAGDIAAEIVAHCAKPVRDASGRANLGLLEAADMAGFRAQSEAPTQTGYRGLKVYKCNTWTQGPALLQALNILETFDIRSMEHNGVRYLHTLIEAIKLAYADREFYYGDPLFSEIPLARLLGSEYARQRAALITERASFELRPGGAPALVAPDIAAVEAVFEAADIRPAQGDTTKLDVVDRFGNVVSATPSGGWLMSSPVIAGLGFPLGTRGQMFSLVLGHPNVVAPGKRPRTTLTPSLALQDGRELLGFGSPGGDSQDQWALQFLLSFVDFGMSLQEAVEAPTVNVAHFPASFYPRRAEPGVVYVEARIAESVTKELEARGHLVRRVHPWSQGNTLAVRLDSETGVRSAAASPRLDPAYALAY
jgi:gamma-glutamyltranspeptidase/glutathione hydrolase